MFDCKPCSTPVDT
jgi:hypothetical protein